MQSSQLAQANILNLIIALLLFTGRLTFDSASIGTTGLTSISLNVAGG